MMPGKTPAPARVSQYITTIKSNRERSIDLKQAHLRKPRGELKASLARKKVVPKTLTKSDRILIERYIVYAVNIIS